MLEADDPFAVKPKLDIIGTYVEEFDTDTDEVVSVKKSACHA